MAQPDRDPSRDTEASGDAAESGRDTGADHDLRARDSYEQILAFLVCNLPKANDVGCETTVFQAERQGMLFPAVPVNPQCVPLPSEEIYAGTVREVQARVSAVEAREFGQAIRGAQSPTELIARLREAIAKAISFRLSLSFLYGVPYEDSVPPSTVLRQAVQARFPDLGGIHIRDDDAVHLPVVPGPETEPEQ